MKATTGLFLVFTMIASVATAYPSQPLQPGDRPGAVVVNPSRRPPPPPPPIPDPYAPTSPSDPGQPPSQQSGDQPLPITPSQDDNGLCAGVYTGNFTRAGEPAQLTFTSPTTLTIDALNSEFEAQGSCVVTSATSADISFSLANNSDYLFTGKISLMPSGQVVMAVTQYVRHQPNGDGMKLVRTSRGQ